MELLEFLDKTVGQARLEARVPTAAVEGASDGDGWVWRWIVSEGERDKREPYRAEIVLVFRPDAFGEKLLTQLVGTAWSVTQPNAAWNQNYSVPHLSLADIKAHTVGAMKFADQLIAQLRICWSDIQQNGPRLRLIARANRTPSKNSRSAVSRFARGLPARSFPHLTPQSTDAGALPPSSRTEPNE